MFGVYGKRIASASTRLNNTVLFNCVFLLNDLPFLEYQVLIISNIPIRNVGNTDHIRDVEK